MRFSRSMKCKAYDRENKKATGSKIQKENKEKFLLFITGQDRALTDPRLSAPRRF